MDTIQSLAGLQKLRIEIIRLNRQPAYAICSSSGSSTNALGLDCVSNNVFFKTTIAYIPSYA